MTTTPQPLVSTTPPTSGFTHWINLIKAHEKLIIVAIMAIVLWHLGDKAYDAYGNYLKAEQNATNSQIAQVEQQNAATQARLDELKATVAAQAKIDNAKIAAAKQKVIVAQQTDAALPLPLLSARWESLVTVPPGSVTPQPNGTVAVTTDAAHLTVNQLESIEPLQEQLSATQDQLKGCSTLSAQKDVQITGLNADIALQVQGRAEDAKVAKHTISVAYRKGLKHGLIIGFAAGIAATVAAIIH
jgi:hypothetical protein